MGFADRSFAIISAFSSSMSCTAAAAQVFLLAVTAAITVSISASLFKSVESDDVPVGGEATLSPKVVEPAGAALDAPPPYLGMLR